jgi:signal transduction histidine kinase
MSPSPESRPRPAQSVPEAIVRTLRHEVGDLLQTVYAAVAILKERLPPDLEMERRILADMRGRAEACKELLDTVHDLVSPLTLDLEDLDLAEVLGAAVTRAASRHPQLEVRLEEAPAPPVRADQRRLGQLAQVLLADACGTAARQVLCRVAPGPGGDEVTWEVLDDGPGVPPERTDLLFNPLTTTPHGHLGPGLALARRLVLMQGGRVTAGNRPDGGFRVAVVLPAAPPPERA